MAGQSRPIFCRIMITKSDPINGKDTSGDATPAYVCQDRPKPLSKKYLEEVKAARRKRELYIYNVSVAAECDRKYLADFVTGDDMFDVALENLPRLVLFYDMPMEEKIQFLLFIVEEITYEKCHWEID